MHSRPPALPMGRLSQHAMSGLLVVFGLFAMTLALTAYFSYRAARVAARDVVLSHAAEAAMSFTHGLLALGPHAPSNKVRALADELARGQVGIALVEDLERVVASSSALAPAPGERVALSADVQRQLGARMPPEAHEWPIDRSARLVFWRAVPPRPRRGGPPPWARPGDDERPGPPPHHLAGPPPPMLLVRVSVPDDVADPVLGPARNTLVMALIASPLGLLAAWLLWRMARRQQRGERDAQRRRSLTALGSMSAVLAHEIRTPLASIKANAQLMHEARPEPRAASVIAECARLERLVNGMLDYARPAPLKLASCDPDALAERAAEIVAPKAQVTGVGLLVDPDYGGDWPTADADQLLQALVNLIQNGLEATAGVGRRDAVVIRVRREGDMVRFHVLDRGPGLGDENPEDLVKSFYTKKEKGTGLGLAIARQVAERHGGELTLHERMDVRGARVTLSIPFGGPP